MPHRSSHPASMPRTHRTHTMRPLRARHLMPVALVIAVAMLSYFAHLVSEAVERGADPRLLARTPADGAPTIAFAPQQLALPQARR